MKLQAGFRVGEGLGMKLQAGLALCEHAPTCRD